MTHLSNTGDDVQPRPVMVAWRVISALAIVVNGWPFLALEFGWIDWTAGQISAYGAFVNLVIGAIALALGVRTERLVTPTANPRDDSLVPLVPIANDAYED